MKYIKKLRNFLKKHDEIDDWKIVHTKTKRFNFYITKNFEIENSLKGEKEEITVTIYKKKDDKMGEADFPVIRFDKEQIKKDVRDALLMCEQSMNPKYELPRKQKYNDKVKICDITLEKYFKKNKLEEISQDLLRRMKHEAAKHKDIKVNSSEAFFTLTETKVTNSKGIKAKSKRTGVYLELAITALDKGKEQEFLASKKVVRLIDLDLEGFLRKSITMARNSVKAKKPKKFEGKVILSGEAIRDFFNPSLHLNPAVMHSSARIRYMKISRYEKKPYISENIKGDKITITSNPQIDYNIASNKFDLEGTASKRVTVVKEGRFNNYIASKKYADYLAVEPTGALGVIEVNHGSKPLEELYKDSEKIVEIVAFAWFGPDDLSGDFNAEIRLGYVIEKGKKIPFRGGMFVGDVFSALSNCYMSKEREKQEGYFGPKAILFNEGVVSGN